MDKDLQNIENLFKSALGNNEEMPSAKVWNIIDNRLDKDTIIILGKKYKTAKRLRLLALLLLSGLSLNELNRHYNKNSVAEKNSSHINKIKKEANNTVLLNEAKNSFHNINPGDNPLPTQSAVAAVGGFVQNFKNNIGKEASSFTKFHLNAFTKTKIGIGNAGLEEQDVSGLTDEKHYIQQSFGEQLSPISFEKPGLQQVDLIDVKKILSFSQLNKMHLTIDANKSTAKKPVNNKQSRFSIAGFFSPDIASYSLDDGEMDNEPGNATEIKKNERHEFSSTLGVLVDYELNKHWALQSGITFSNINIVIDPKTIYAQADYNGNIKYRLNFSSGYGYLVPSFQPNPSAGDSLSTVITTHQLQYIGIPVSVKYRIAKGKFIIETLAGISTNFLAAGKLSTEIQKGPDNELEVLNKIEGLKQVYFSGLAGVGAAYSFTDKLSFILMPTARFALSSINKNAVVKTFPNSVGLAAGLKWKF